MVMRGVDEAIKSYCEDRYKTDRLAARDCYEEMLNYLDLYSDDIDNVGLKRRESKYCIGNISFITIARKKLFESAYPGFVEFLGKKVVLRRVYMTIVEMVCCLDANVRYRPEAKKFTYVEDVSEGVEESLGEWMEEYATPGMRDMVEKYGGIKCNSLSSSLYLCDWWIVRSDVWEERE